MREKAEKLFRSKWFTCALLVLGALGVGFLSLAFAPASNRWDMMESYFRRPLLILLNMLPCLVLVLALWLLTNRPAVAYIVMASLVFGLTMGNWYKLQFRNDPLMFGDLLLLKEAGNMLGRYSLFLTPFLAASLIVLVGWALVVGFCGKGRFRPVRDRLGWLRFALAGGLILLCVPLSFLYTDSTIYNKKTENYDCINRWAATQVYTSKGFLYPFLHSVSSAFPSPPEGYSKAEAQEILGTFSDQDIPEGKKVDVIAVMLEAFNDFSKYDQIRFARDDVYQAWHELEAQSVSGNLVTSIFAGGTVQTERNFLTGCSNLSSFRGTANSYAWYFLDQGYTTTGSHPSYGWFYNRMNINENLGFQSYLFGEDHYGELAEEGTTIARDRVLFPELERLYDEHKKTSDAPYFSFSVTYQGHGPYSTEESTWGSGFVEPGVYTPATENILNNYFGSVQSTGEEVSAFASALQDREDPVILVVFGDHNPWLGDDNSVYKELGIDLDLSGKQGFLNYYSTRYLIWANDAAKKVLGNGFTGQGPDISPNFLMNQVFSLCGWEGPAFLQYTDSVMEELPVVQTGDMCVTADGEFQRELQGEQKELREQLRRVEYYMRREFLYQAARGGE